MDDDEERRRQVRRSGLVFGAIALAFYLGFILMGMLGS